MAFDAARPELTTVWRRKYVSVSTSSGVAQGFLTFLAAVDGKLKYNIKYILEEVRGRIARCLVNTWSDVMNTPWVQGFRWKTPELVVLVKAVRFDSDDAKVTLRDPSGDMDGTISRQTIEEFPDLQQGAVLVLKDVACFSPKQSVHHLIITEANVSKVRFLWFHVPVLHVLALIALRLAADSFVHFPSGTTWCVAHVLPRYLLRQGVTCTSQACCKQQREPANPRAPPLRPRGLLCAEAATASRQRRGPGKTNFR
jgi:hypothetical protein